MRCNSIQAKMATPNTKKTTFTFSGYNYIQFCIIVFLFSLLLTENDFVTELEKFLCNLVPKPYGKSPNSQRIL